MIAGRISVPMPHGPELSIVVLACLALVVGVVNRWVSERTRFPYSAGMLLVGLGLGVIAQRAELPAEGLLHAAFRSGMDVSPETIIFVFLPALVFESAFGIEVHAFKKNLGPIVLLALPVLIVSAFATAAVMIGLRSIPAFDVTLGAHFGWPAALVFGALISATDPVAVVAVLREVNAPKRLAVVIEGESLLNDGTAIVLFTVLLGLLATSAGNPVDALDIASRFIWVVMGGIGVGLALALIGSDSIGRTFNDPTVEITVTLVVAYGAMLIGEGLLHVSGVMAVVVTGLWMSGPGRTRISPEVAHFLHRFWGMLAFVANTLIFLLVGFVIANQVHGAEPVSLLLIVVAYLAIVVIRFGLIYLSRPLMRFVGPNLSLAEATVLSWGGLRGAVSLALALVVSRHPAVPDDVGRSILLVTAGFVLLTILVNGTTTGWLLRRLGFDEPDAGEALASLRARVAVLGNIEQRIHALAQSRDLRSLPWRTVEATFAERQDRLLKRLTRLEAATAAGSTDEREIGLWKRAVAVERRAYHRAFDAGTLGRNAVRVLDHEIDVQLDRLDARLREPPASRVPEVVGWRAGLARALRRLHIDLAGLRFDRLALSYDLFRAEELAATEVLQALSRWQLAGATAHHLDATYRRYRDVARERLEDLRTNLPEVTQAIEARLSQRIVLNLERRAYASAMRRGELPEQDGERLVKRTERRMKKLRGSRRRLALPETADLCRDSHLFRDFDDRAHRRLAEITREIVLSPGETLFREGDGGDSFFVVARGAVKVVRQVGDHDVVVDTLGGGDVFGEMSMLAGEARRATIVAATTVTLGEVKAMDFAALMTEHEELREGIWRSFAARRFYNLQIDDPGLHHLDRQRRQDWFDHALLIDHRPGRAIPLTEDHSHVFVITGVVELGAVAVPAPDLLRLGRAGGLRSRADGRLALLPAPPAAWRERPSRRRGPAAP